MKKLSLFVLLFGALCFPFSGQAKRKEDPEKEKEEKISNKELKKANYSLWLSEKRVFFDNTDKFMGRLKAKLLRGEIVGLEILVAAPTDARIESMWGHSMLRFVDNSGSFADDMVLGFVAEVDDMRLSNFKGIFGGYPVYPNLKTFRLFNQQYLKIEDRPLDRFIIPSNKAQREGMISWLIQGWMHMRELDRQSYAKAVETARRKILKKMKAGEELEEVLADNGEIVAFSLNRKAEGDQAPEKKKNKKDVNVVVEYVAQEASEFGPYTFFTRNCTGALYEFFQHAGFMQKLSLRGSGRVPVHTQGYLERKGLVYFPKNTVPSILPMKNKVKAILALDEEKFYDFSSWPPEAPDLLVNGLSPREKWLLLETYPLLSDDVQTALLSANRLLKKPSYDELMGISAVPEVMYELCADADCAGAQREQAFTVWPEELVYKSLNGVAFPENQLFQNYYKLITQE